MSHVQSKGHWITGVGALSAAGIGVPATRARFFSQHADVRTNLDTSQKDFLKLAVHPEWTESLQLQTPYHSNLFAAYAAIEALASAGISREELRRLRVGVCLGSTVGGTNCNLEFNPAFHRGEKPSGISQLDYFTSNSAQFLLRYLGCKGPTLLVSNACTSGADALGIASSWLDADHCDLVICGGTELMLERIYYGFRSLLLCSPVPCQPFDVTRQGLTLGEGAGIVILEKAGSPRQAMAHLLGYGVASDALHPTAPHPEARGLGRAINQALRQSELELNDIDFINAHGTATVQNDLSEGRWIANHANHARVVATKGYTGHTLGAAGALEAVFSVLSLQDGKLPASKGFVTADPAIGVVPTSSTETGDFKYALSFSLGFGGINSVLCLGRAQ